MANEDLVNRDTHCYICAKTIENGKDTPRKITCSDECAKLRIRILRKRVDDRECRFCHKASTPTQRKAFSRFRRWEREHPDVAYPEAWTIMEAAGMSLADFGKAVGQAAKRDIALDQMPAEWWGAPQTDISKAPNPKPAPELDRAIEILLAFAKQRAEEAAEIKRRIQADEDAAWEAEGAPREPTHAA